MAMLTYSTICILPQITQITQKEICENLRNLWLIVDTWLTGCLYCYEQIQIV